MRLKALNLDGNPLSDRLVEGGPTLLEVWMGPAASGGGSAGEGGDDGRGAGEGHAGDDVEGGADDAGREAGSSGGAEAADTGEAAPGEGDCKATGEGAGTAPACSTGATLSARRREAAAAAAAARRLRRRADRLLSYLTALQEPPEALAVKQAKLALLQARARARLEQLVRVADPEALAACLVSEGAAARGGCAHARGRMRGKSIGAALKRARPRLAAPTIPFLLARH